MAGLERLGNNIYSLLEDADIVCLQETWARKIIPLKGYYGYGSPAVKLNLFGRPSGGLATYVRHDSNVILEKVSGAPMNFQVFRFKNLSLNGDKIHCLLLNCYLNPQVQAKTREADQLVTYLASLLMDFPFCETILVGDLNLKGLGELVSKTGLAARFQTFLDQFNLKSAKFHWEGLSGEVIPHKSFRDISLID